MLLAIKRSRPTVSIFLCRVISTQTMLYRKPLQFHVHAYTDRVMHTQMNSTSLHARASWDIQLFSILLLEGLCSALLTIVDTSTVLNLEEENMPIIGPYMYNDACPCSALVLSHSKPTHLFSFSPMSDMHLIIGCCY